MKKAIIYGGAFNPPTNGHQTILQACFHHAKDIRSEVWIMPSGNRSDKSIAVSREHRLQMIESLIASVDTSEVSHRIEEIELQSKSQTETYETYKNLRKLYPDVKQVWVFGSDSIQTMKSWGEGEWLYNNLSMLVIERPGYKLASLPPHAELLPLDSLDISSTLVREHITNNRDIAHLVPKHVHKTILNLGLFL